MKLLGAAAIATGMLLAHDAEASSFVVLDAPRSDVSRSILVLGEPALGDPPVVRAAPDETIKTAALATGSPAHAATALFGEAVSETAERPAAPLSRSMILLGKPAPNNSPGDKRTAALDGRASLPIVIRGGLVGEAFPLASRATQPRATQLPIPEEIAPEAPPTPETPVVTERRTASSKGPPPPGGNREPPEPPALPAAPPPPPPPTRTLE